MARFACRAARWARALRVIVPAVLVGTCGAMATGQTTPPMVVENDRGGLIGARALEISRINTQRMRVELRGRFCYSSCTMYLGAANVCVSPETTFGFHGPSRRGAALEPDMFDHWSQVMADHYRPALRDWFLQEARHRIRGYYRISGEQLIAMGYPAC